ncbi:MAG: hypothetical protein K2Q01_06310, partial [Rickettsiales bacterium]|nr:hypothetical protein [Rickettsiales bacterium]
MSLFTRISIAVVAALWLAGCIVVDDFGEYWNKGFIDNCVNEIELDSHDHRPHAAKTMLMRSLRVGKHTFL